MLHRPGLPSAAATARFTSKPLYDENAHLKSGVVAAPPSRSALAEIGNGTTRPALTLKRPAESIVQPARARPAMSAHVVDIDAVDAQNPQACVELITEVMEYLREKEIRDATSSTYINSQADIKEQMRAILVDWLVEVHLKFKLQPETLYLSVQLVDRYLTVRPCTRSKLQLIGVVAMLIASKTEEVYAPYVKDFVYISDKAYPREEILKTEREMLNALQWNVTVPTVLPFLKRYTKAAAAVTPHANLAHLTTMFAELCMQEYKMLRYPPSTIAAASVLAALKTLGLSWTATLDHYTRLTESSIKGCAREVLELRRSGSKTLHAIKNKYSQAAFGRVWELPSPAGEAI